MILIFREFHKAGSSSLNISRQPYMDVNSTGRQIQYHEVTSVDWSRENTKKAAAEWRNPRKTTISKRAQSTRMGNDVAQRPTGNLIKVNEAVAVTYRDMTPRLSVLEKAMNFLQASIALPILWWPLPIPRKVLAQGSVRMEWNCSTCSSHMSIDISAAAAEALRTRHPPRETDLEKRPTLNLYENADDSRFDGEDKKRDAKISPHGNEGLTQRSAEGTIDHSSSGGSPDPSSSYTSISSDSTSVSIPTKAYTQRRTRTYPPSQVDISINTASKQVDVHIDKWIHWCVDASKTRLYEICVEAKTGAKRGVDFIQELVSSYRRIRGIRAWFSLMDCAEVKVVKFICLLDGQDLVRCNSDKVKLEEILRNREYEISTTVAPDEELHIGWVEETLSHYLRCHRQEASNQEIDMIIQGLPKKMKASVGRKAMSVGYGIRSVQALSFARFLCVMVICFGFGISFFVFWLVKHPGDIQNASVPYFMIMAAAGAFIAFPDFYIQ
jgi:hypothetical protein